MKKMKMFGMVKVGSKGQIVIPKTARDEFDISTGDEFFVMSGPHHKSIVMFKADTLDMMKQMVDEMTDQVKKIRDAQK